MQKAQTTTAKLSLAAPAGALQALLALLLSALALLALVLVVAPGQPLAPRQGETAHRVFSGSDFKVVIGKADRGAQRLTITEVEDGRGLFVRRSSLIASRYSFLHFDIDKLRVGQSAYLVWRTRQTGDQLFNLRLRPASASGGVATLAESSDWAGEVTEIGIDYYADSPLPGTSLGELSFTPYTASGAMQALWAQWREFSGWNQSSINNLRNTAASVSSPVLSAALWWLLATVILSAWFLKKRRINLMALLLTAAGPWLLLDLLWQQKLGQQLAATQGLFEGKTQHERHLADLDGNLYAYAQHLITEALPAPGSRIHLLHRQGVDEIHNYRRLRLQYHLLPHNIYNYGTLPRFRHLRRGDYLLQLDDIDELIYDPTTAKLHWGGRPRIPVVLIDEHKQGRLFKVTRKVKIGR